MKSFYQSIQVALKTPILFVNVFVMEELYSVVRN